MPPVALRPRSVTEIIDAAARLLRLHYKELVTAAALFLIPLAALQIIVIGDPTQMATRMVSGSFWIGLSVFSLVAVMVASLSTAATVVIVSESYIGHEVSISAAIQRVISRVWPLVAASLIQTIFVGVGFLLFIIPGIVFFAWTFAMPIIVLVERKDPMEAFSRSRNLARGSVPRIWGTILLAAIIVWVFSAIGSVILGLLANAGHFSAIANALVSAGIRILVYPFFTVVTVLLYYDLRIRKEGYDLELMAQELGSPPPTPAASGAPG